MPLLNLIEKFKITSLALIGTGKNVGKTVLLNYLIKEFNNFKILGLTSIGRDGESQDILSNFEKPKIFAPASALLITTQKSLLNARYKILYSSNIFTPLGKLILVKILKKSKIELCGPQTIGQLKRLIPLFYNYGANLVLIDGAFNRKIAAAPLLTQGTILVSGAALNSKIEEVIKETAFKVKILTLPELKNSALMECVKKILPENKNALIQSNGRLIFLDDLLSLDTAKKINKNALALFLKGALTDFTLEKILKLKLKIIVSDPTKILISKEVYAKFKGEIKVLKKINLLALAINPFSPYGWKFTAQEFLSEMAKNVFPLPVIDVVLKQGFNL